MKAQWFIIKAAVLLFSAVLCSSNVLGQTASVPARVAQPVNVENMVVLHGNVHPLARPEFDQGLAPDDLLMERVLLVLQRSADQEAALRRLLDDQQVKSSPRFHQWLTPEQFGQQFGPADADIEAVTGWLAGQGFQVSKVSAGRTVIEFSGTAGLVRQALGTEIHKYAVNGKNYWANASDPAIPAALAPVVAGFASLNNFPRKPMYRRLGTFSRTKATGEVQPLFTIPVSCGSGTCYYFALGPMDFATIYNVSPLWNASPATDGTGQTIAIVSPTNINIQDAQDFRSMFGLPANNPNIILNGPDPGINGAEPEADLDVQWSGAVAKGATIDLVVSEDTESTAGVDLSALYIVDNNLAPVMSVSYGGCEAELGASGNLFHSTLWEQAAAQGITVLIAAGDGGSAMCDYGVSPEFVALAGLSVNGLASTPFDVAVGGTDFNDTSDPLTYWSLTNTSTYESSALSYIPESTWNDTCAASGALTGCANASSNSGFQEGIDLVAGGGGPSNCTSSTGTYPNFTCSGGYSKPPWQSGTGVPDDNARDVPDVSLFAGNGLHYSFYVFCEMDANSSNGGNGGSCDLNSPYTDFQGAGGTSISAQAFAGIMAMVNQKYGRQGNANFVLYPMAAQGGAACTSNAAAVSNSKCIFYDTVVGNNSVACAGGSPDCSDTTSGQYGILVSGTTPAWTTTAGYDLATGLGSVNVANLVNKWTSNFTPSTTTLSLSTSPPTTPIQLSVGQTVNFTVSVAPGSGSGTPTGDISLIAQTANYNSTTGNGGVGIGPFTLSNGSVSTSTDMLPGGQYNVIAHYAGNGTFGASDSAGIPVNVGTSASVTNLELVTFNLTTGVPFYGATNTPYGSSYFLRINVANSNGQPCASSSTGAITYPCPTGTVTVTPAPTDQNPPAGTVPGSYVLNSQGYAEDQPIQQSPGTYNFVASYAGDNSYTASTSPVTPITITQAPTSIAAGATTPAATQVTLTATISTQSNGVAPTGTVQFYNGSTAFGPLIQVLGTPYSAATNTPAFAKASYAGLSTPGGVYSLTAQYSGDNNYAAATSGPVSLTVSDYSLAVNPTSINIAAPGQSGTTTVTLTPEFGFTGTVYITCGELGSAPGILCTSSPAALTLSGTAAQTATLTISTTASSMLGPPWAQPRAPLSLRLPGGLVWWGAGLMALVAGFILRRRRRARTAAFAGGLLILAVGVACGGGSGGGSTSAPTYPNATFAPTTLTFGSQATNTPSPTLAASLINTGGSLMTVSNVTLGGPNAGDFSQTNTCAGSSVAPASTCSFTIGFTPQAAGSRTATISVSDYESTNGQQTQTLTLTGTGAQPLLSISPSSLSFGKVLQYSQSSPQTLTLTNISNSAITVSDLQFEGQDYKDFEVVSNTCGFNSNIAAGASCIVKVTLDDFDLGPLSALLDISLNDGSYQQTVPLSGTGVLPSTPAGTYQFNVWCQGNNDFHNMVISVTVQ